MFNKAPIFVNGFQRGGTNILMNLIVSHPEVCMLGGETQVVFYGHGRQPIKKWGARILSIPILFSTWQHTFWPYRFYERKKINIWILKYIDLIFYWSKIMAPRNRFKYDGTRNTIPEIANARLLCKNVNGVVLASHIFADMYPDATMIGLVRNGLAICEGFLRRGWTAERVGKMYEKICQQMIHDANKMENYQLIYFEDIILDPVQCVNRIYNYIDLDIKLVQKFKMQAKKSTNKDGSRSYTFGGTYDRETHWYPIEEISNQFRKDVNENQIARLSYENKKIFLKHAGKSMEQLGYL